MGTGAEPSRGGGDWWRASLTVSGSQEGGVRPPASSKVEGGSPRG